jgi:tRNA-dihydrouridine synthase A
VHRLVRDFPELTFIMNGGINTFQQAKTHVDVDNKYTFFTSTPSETDPAYETLPAVDGVMIGRAAFNNPAMFATADSEFYGVKDPCLTRRQILERYIDYCDWCQSEDGPNYTLRGKTTVVTTSVLLNAMRNIMHGLPNVQRFRTALNDVYMEKLRGMNGSPNPRVRDVVSQCFPAVSAVVP